MKAAEYKATESVSFHGVNGFGLEGATLVLLADDRCSVDVDTVRAKAYIQTKYELCSVDIDQFILVRDNGVLVPVPAEVHPPVQVPPGNAAAHVAGMLRDRPQLMFDILRELHGVKLAGPWAHRHNGLGGGCWERHDAHTLESLVSIRPHGRNTGAWLTTFAGAKGEITQTSTLVACKAFANRHLQAQGYILCGDE